MQGIFLLLAARDLSANRGVVEYCSRRRHGGYVNPSSA